MRDRRADDTWVIAVDGPTAAGKTTTSRRIAGKFALHYLESGRGYRLIAYMALQEKVDLADELSLMKICDSLLEDRTYQAIFSASDEDAAYLRTRPVTTAVSYVAKAPALREKITELTRSWANSCHGCVIEGRDIGTAVFPDARVKIFLTATPEVRARRRLAETVGQTYDEILQDLILRDKLDSSRTHSPLTPALDAAIIDTSELTVNSVVEMMLNLCFAAGAGVSTAAGVIRSYNEN